MKSGKILLLIDAIINLFLGAVLLLYSKPVITFFGLPETELFFYPNILGAVLLGISGALLIEYKRKGTLVGLGIGGAITINLIGGFILLLWLVLGNLDIPLKGRIILWILNILLLGISLFEIMSLRKSNYFNSSGNP